MALDVFGEARDIQIQLLGFGDQVFTAELVLASQGGVVHFPEFALLGGGQGGFVGPAGIPCASYVTLKIVAAKSRRAPYSQLAIELVMSPSEVLGLLV